MALKKTSAPKVYIALLRGINVGGHKSMPMQKLRETCTKLGFDSVTTHIQSGNVLFQTASLSPESISERLAKGIEKDFGFSVPIVIRTRQELSAITKKQPFLKKKPFDPAQVVVVFLSKAPDRAHTRQLIDRIQAVARGAEDFKLVGKELFLYCPNGLGKSKLATLDFERLLAVGATARNWNTVTKLLELASSSPYG